MGNESSIALPKSMGANRPARLCPFTGVAVPSLDPTTGRPKNPEFPLVMEKSTCGPECALYDVAHDRTCLERVLHAIFMSGGVAPAPASIPAGGREPR